MTLFVQLYESNTEAVKSEIGTFMEVFPNGVVWGNTNNGAGYDLVLMGQVDDTKIDVDAIQAKLDRPEYAPMKQSLREIGMNSAVDLFSTFAGRASDLKPWLADAVINRDRNLRLQFLAGMGLNLYQSDVDLLRHACPRPPLPGRALRRLARDDERAARRHPAGTRAVDGVAMGARC